MSSTTLELDALDHRIIALLQQDAHQTNRQIALKTGTSEPTVRRRIDRLLAAQVIKIVAVASPFSLGYPVMVILGIQIDRSLQSQIEQALQTMFEVRFVGITLGGYDMVAEVWLKSNDELLDFLSNRLGRIAGIQRVEPWQIIKLSKYSYDWGQQPSA